MKTRIFIGLWMLASAVFGGAWAEETPKSATSETGPYLEPKVLTGKICDLNHPGTVLFQFRRTATNSGSMVFVLREYTLPDGKLASRERVVYDRDQLLSYELEDLQAGTHGTVAVQTNATGKSLMKFEFTKGATKKTDRETCDENTLINDMVAPYILKHWDALTNGETVKLRLVAMSRTETVGFKLTQAARSTWQGHAVAKIRMEPSSLIISQFIDPLSFTVEIAEPHRIFEYSGRTTPSINRNGKWQDLDALTIFDWPTNK